MKIELLSFEEYPNWKIATSESFGLTTVQPGVSPSHKSKRPWMSERKSRKRGSGSGVVARRVLGVLLVAMAAGQLSDVGGFVDVLDTYRVGGGAAAAIIGVALLVSELVAGVGLLGRSPRRWTGVSRLAMVVAVAWTALGAQAFARGLFVPNCGCFGVHLGQPLRRWVLLEDVEFVALAWWAHRASTRIPRATGEPAGETNRNVEAPA